MRFLLRLFGNTTAEKDVIERCMGTFGRWQVVVTLAIFLVKFPVAWHQLAIVIEGPPVGNFTCIEPTLDKCDPHCPEHVFDRSVFEETIITQWDLVCSRAFLANLAQTITMLGILAGNLIFGIVSDKWGRRNPLVFAVIMQLLCGSASAYIPNFLIYLLFRFLTAIATGGTMITSFVLTMEIIGIKWRTPIGILYQIPFNLAHLTLSPIGYFLRDWKYQQLAISLPSLLLISYYFILPESPRWLLAVDQPEEAIRVLESVASKNRLPTNHIKDEVANYMQKKDVAATKKSSGNLLDLFRTPNIRKNWFCISFNWIVCGLCFFGVSQYIGNIGGNMFVNIAFSALITIPGTIYSIWSMKALGRKKTLILSNFFPAVAFLVIAFLPDEPNWPRTLLGTLGLFGSSVSFPTVYIYTGELFPTVIRNIGIGSCSMCARIGSMVAPFAAGLSTVAPWAPSLVFGIMPVIGTLLAFLLPETLDCKLPDSVEEAEAFGKKEVKVKSDGK